MERMIIEYLANAFWQLPVLAAGAWLLLRMWKPGPAAQHRVWLAVLALGLLLPLRGAFHPAATELPVADAGPALLANSDLPQASQGNAPHRMQKTPGFLGEESSSPATAEATDFHSEYASWVSLAAALFSECVHRVSLNSVAAQWIVGFWLAVALLGLLRIALSWRAAQQLVENSQAAVLGERERYLLLDCSRRVGVATPEIRNSDAIAGPVIVGAAKPVLLWPENFSRTSEDEMRAALFHELAHVRRRDYGMNLLCEMAALPLKWHPATHKLERRIRATREMACDAIAAQAMDSETIYAECLVRLARRIVGRGAMESSPAAGLFNGNVMEERVMRLMRGTTAMSLQAKLARGVAGAAAMAAAILLAGAFHVTPAMAQGAPVLPAMPPAPAQMAAPTVTALPPAQAKPSAPAVSVSAQPVVLAPAVSPIAKVGAVPLVPSVSPVVHVTLAPVVSPEVAVPPTPAVPQNDSKPIVITNGQVRELTPAERARVEKQLVEAQKRIAAATAKINSPEFRKKLQDEIDAAARLNSAEVRKQMADAQQQIAEATAKINSPEFQKNLQDEIDAAAKLNSAEVRKQMADARKQIAAATARLNSPEFRKQIEDATREAMNMNSAEFQRQMANAQKEIADAMAKMKAEQEKDAGKKGPRTGVQGTGK